MIVDRYYYSQLSIREQAIYRAFYNGVMSHQDIIPLNVKGNISKTALNRVFAAVTRDNPLIYFINQSLCSVSKDNNGNMAIIPQYFFSYGKVREYNRKIEKTIAGLGSELNLTEGTDIEKEIKIHDWICQNVKYDYEGADLSDVIKVILSHNIIGVFAHRKAQCEGIAKAVKVLLNAVDIKCIVVTGNAMADGKSEEHAWNIVSLNNNAYQLDVTWDLSAYMATGRLSYEYYNVTDSFIGKDHTADSKLPVCKTKFKVKKYIN